MPIIAMTREMASSGKDVALGLAEELGLSVIHHELVEHDVAGKIHVGASAVHRYLEGKIQMFDRWSLEGKSVALFTAAELFELAEKGNVIIRGWGGAQLLRPVAHVLCLRVCAPLACRVRTLMQRLAIDDEELAQKEIEENDAAHERVLKRIVNADWRDPVLYDLVINTKRVSIEEGIALAKHMLEQPSFQESPESRAELRRQKVMAQAQAVLKADPDFGRDNGTVNVAVDEDACVVSLSGMVSNRETRSKAERTVATLSNVQHVNNELQVLQDFFGD